MLQRWASQAHGPVPALFLLRKGMKVGCLHSLGIEELAWCFAVHCMLLFPRWLHIHSSSQVVYAGPIFTCMLCKSCYVTQCPRGQSRGGAMTQLFLFPSLSSASYFLFYLMGVVCVCGETGVRVFFFWSDITFLLLLILSKCTLKEGENRCFQMLIWCRSSSVNSI